MKSGLNLLKVGAGKCRPAICPPQKTTFKVLKRKLGCVAGNAELNTTHCDQIISSYTNFIKDYEEKFGQSATNLGEDLAESTRELLTMERSFYVNLMNECEYDSLKKVIKSKIEFYDNCEALMEEMSNQDIKLENLDRTLAVHGASELTKTYLQAAEIQSLYSLRDALRRESIASTTTRTQMDQDQKARNLDSILKMKAELLAIVSVTTDYCKTMMNNLLYLRQGFFYAQHPEMLKIAEKELSNANYDIAFGSKYDELTSKL